MRFRLGKMFEFKPIFDCISFNVFNWSKTKWFAVVLSEGQIKHSKCITACFTDISAGQLTPDFNMNVLSFHTSHVLLTILMTCRSGWRLTDVRRLGCLFCWLNHPQEPDGGSSTLQGAGYSFWTCVVQTACTNIIWSSFLHFQTWIKSQIIKD